MNPKTPIKNKPELKELILRLVTLMGYDGLNHSDRETLRRAIERLVEDL